MKVELLNDIARENGKPRMNETKLGNKKKITCSNWRFGTNIKKVEWSHSNYDILDKREKERERERQEKGFEPFKFGFPSFIQSNMNRWIFWN